jgi:hypothetical protein
MAMNVVAAVLPFVLIGLAILVIVARQAQSQQLSSTESEMEGEPFSALSISLAFELDHAIIWETQVPALKLIRAAGPRGIRVQRLHSWYLESAGHYPELYDGCSFRRWLEFLEQAQLIAQEAGRVLLTENGVKFLEYRVVVQPEMAFQPSFSSSETE